MSTIVRVSSRNLVWGGGGGGGEGGRRGGGKLSKKALDYDERYTGFMKSSKITNHILVYTDSTVYLWGGGGGGGGGVQP